LVRPLPSYLYDWPVIGEVARWLNDVCQAIQDEIGWWISQIWQYVPKNVRDFIDKVKNFLTAAWDKFVKLITDPKEFFKEVFDALWSLLPEPIKSIFTKVSEFVDTVWARLLMFIRDPVGSLKGLVDEVWKALPKEVRDTLSTTKDNVLKLPGIIAAKASELGATVEKTFDSWGKELRDRIAKWGDELSKGINEARDRMLVTFDGVQTAVSNAIGGLPTNLWDGFWNFWTVTVPRGIGTVMSMLSPANISSWFNTLMQHGKGLSEIFKSPIQRFYEKVMNIARGKEAKKPEDLFLDLIGLLVEVVAQIELSTVAIELAIPWKNTGLGGSVGAALMDMTMGAAVGSVTGTFFEALLRIPTRMLNEAWRGNFPDITAASQMYYRNKLSRDDLVQVMKWMGYDDKYIEGYLNMITDRPPAMADMTRLFFRGEASEDDLRKVLKYSGISPEWHDKLVKTIYEIPGESDLFRMWFRGIIDEDALDKMLKARGYDSETIDRLKMSAWFYPGVSDLIRFFIREAIPSVHGELARAKLVGMPREFYEYGRKAGIPDEWVEAFWASHWQLPSVEQVYRMFWRGLTSPYSGRPFMVDDVDKFLAEADVDPRWRDNLVEIAYNLPGRIDARWGLEWGIWDERRFEQFLKSEGYHPDWIPDILAIEKKNVFREHYNAVMSAALRLYQRGYMTREQLQNTLRDLGYPDEVIKYRMWQADLQQEAEIKDDLLKATVQDFRDGKITADELRSILSGIIVIPERLDQIVRLETARAQKRGVAKETLQTQLESLRDREKSLVMKLTDLRSDLDNQKKLMEAELKIWDTKIETQERLLEVETRPDKRAAIQDRINLLKSQRERARIYYENKIAELQESIGFVEQQLEDVRSKISALEEALKAGTIAG